MSTKMCIICKECSDEFDIVKKEYNRQIKNGRQPDQFFCSLSCTASWKNKNRSEEEQAKQTAALILRSKGNTYGRANKKGDFTYFLNKARQRPQETNIDEEYLQSIWTGRCAISNIPIIMKNTKVKNTINTASLDRIDSSKGYVKGNVQFVAYGINLAKNTFEDNDVHLLIKEIVNHYLSLSITIS